MITRRNFLCSLARCGLVAGASLSAFEIVNMQRLLASETNAGPRYAFLIDVESCCGCGLCVRACKLENDVPYESVLTNTWIERYVVSKDGRVLADSPRSQDGFISGKIEVGRGKTEEVKESEIKKAFFVPKVCNHCDEPSCVQVCPVGATYKTESGVVLVDSSWCIGCGYCIQACPYGARYMHPIKHTASKCTFCFHRLQKGLQPVCVEMCPTGARQFANLSNPDDPVARRIRTEKVAVLKAELGNKPQAFYLNLKPEVS